MSTASDKFEVFSGFSPYSTVGPSRAADYWQLEEGAPYELVRGRLMMSPAPTPYHQTVLTCLIRAFAKIEDRTGGLSWPAPIDVLLSDDTVLQPDLVYVCKERLSIVNKHVAGAPDLVVEILSPSTSRRDKTEKLDLYAKYGVAEYWIVDPATKVFEFLLLKEGCYVVQQQPDDRYCSPRLPELEIDLAYFWAEVERRLPQKNETQPKTSS